MVRRLACLTALLVGVAPPARAQDLAALCRQLAHPPVGAWSEFKVTGGRGDGTSMRMAVVGRETRGDSSLLWLEIAVRGMPLGMGEARNDSLVIVNKMLVPGYGPGMAEPRAHVMKFGSLPAMTMPENQRGPGGAAPALHDCGDGKVVGWESVTVPAGTFRALHVQDADGSGDAWVVPTLPFGMVKVADADSGFLVLTGHGTGARSQITETPQPYDPQAFMRLLMQGTGRD